MSRRRLKAASFDGRLIPAAALASSSKSAYPHPEPSQLRGGNVQRQPSNAPPVMIKARVRATPALRCGPPTDQMRNARAIGSMELMPSGRGTTASS